MVILLILFFIFINHFHKTPFSKTAAQRAYHLALIQVSFLNFRYFFHGYFSSAFSNIRLFISNISSPRWMGAPIGACLQVRSCSVVRCYLAVSRSYQMRICFAISSSSLQYFFQMLPSFFDYSLKAWSCVFISYTAHKALRCGIAL